MFQAIEVSAKLAQDRIEREIAFATMQRAARQPSASVRQAIGYRFIRLGARLAAEPTLESVRSR
ncbi:MAG: hypothetical protein QOG32_909 [Chloroflexota bacterium]|nr:hypothetical protein [Chloroflexota bacterium]